MPRGKPNDLTGKTFGSWKVLYKIGATSSGKIMWMCLCQCGKDIPVVGMNLVSGKSTRCRSCGNKGRKGRSLAMDLAGKRFGAWTVLRRSSRIGAKHSLWVCKCDCGTPAVLPYSSLCTGRSTQCRSCGTRQAHATRRANSAASD